MSRASCKTRMTPVIALAVTMFAVSGCTVPRVGQIRGNASVIGTPRGFLASRGRPTAVESVAPQAAPAPPAAPTERVAPPAAAAAGVRTVSDEGAGSPEVVAAEHRQWAEERAASEARIAALEGQIAWLRNDLARLQQLLNNVQKEAGQYPQPGGVRPGEQETLRKYVAELRLAVEAANQSSAVQRESLDGLTRRVAELESALRQEHAREIQALDGVIDGMEKLIQLQDEQFRRPRSAGPVTERNNR